MSELEPPRTVCVGCGHPMVWGITTDGKRIPLDPSAPCYRYTVTDTGVVVTRDTNVMVSHFKTCSKANQFSGSRKNV